MKYITDFREGERICQVFFCKNKTVASAKTGKTYYSLVLQDKTGTLDAKVWDLNGAIEHFENAEFIYTEGRTVVYNGTLQFNVSRIRRASAGEYDQREYFPVSEKNPDEMYKELIHLASTVREPHLHALLESFFVKDKAFIQEFTMHSAAKSIHHGFISGLLEHTLAVAKLCDFYSTQYSMLNRDLLITAALFHDIGKIREISSFPENDYTDQGQLLGHIVIGYQMLKERMDTIKDFPPQLATELLHCILAHHGELEYGSPKKPALMEALALSFADNTDAKLQTMKEALQLAQPGVWLGFNRTLESNIRRTGE